MNRLGWCVSLSLNACGPEPEGDGGSGDPCDSLDDDLADKGVHDCDAIDVEFGVTLTDPDGHALPATIDPDDEWTMVWGVQNLTDADLTIRSGGCLVENFGLFVKGTWQIGVFDFCKPTETEVPASGVWSSGPFLPVPAESGQQLGGMVIFLYEDSAGADLACLACADDVTVRGAH